MAVFAAIMGGSVLARTFGVQLPVFITLPTFLAVNTLLQPPFPGVRPRSLRQRAVVALTIGLLAAVVLWLLNEGTR